MAKLGPSRGSVLFVDASRRKQSQKSIGGGARRSRMSGPVKSNSYLDQLTRTSRGDPQTRGKRRELSDWFGADQGFLGYNQFAIQLALLLLSRAIRPKGGQRSELAALF